MPFIIRNGSDTLTYSLKDQYLDLLIAPSEHVDLEQVFPEDSLYMSSVSPNALYTSIQDGSIIRRNDTDTADIAAVNAFDDTIWRWSPTRQQKEALIGQPLSPSSINRYLTQGVFSLKAKVTGTARYGDIVLLEGTNITITDNGSGTFTIAGSSFGSPVTLIPDGGNVDGTSTSVARADHKHNIVADPAVSVTTANAEGTSTSISRADHAHQGIHSLKATAGGTARYGDLVFLAGTNIAISDDGAGNFTFSSSESYAAPVTIIPDDGNAEGTNTTVARSDHRHNLPAATPSTIPLNTANAEGTSASVARADHIHNLPTAAPITIIPDGGNSEGTSTSVARADHRHDLPAATPVSIGTTNAEGTSTSVARADHVHAYALTGSIKAGVVASGSFTGNPKKATVTFTTAFATTGYSITITGVNARTWTYESKTTGGFTINANANANLTGDVSWKAAQSGS